MSNCPRVHDTGNIATICSISLQVDITTPKQCKAREQQVSQELDKDPSTDLILKQQQTETGDKIYFRQNKESE